MSLPYETVTATILQDLEIMSGLRSFLCYGGILPYEIMNAYESKHSDPVPELVGFQSEQFWFEIKRRVQPYVEELHRKYGEFGKIETLEKQ